MHAFKDAKEIDVHSASPKNGSNTDEQPDLTELLAAADLLGHDPDAALAAAQALISSHPDSGLCWKLLGSLLTMVGRHADALEPLSKATGLLPEDAETWFNLGTTYGALGKLTDEVACYQSALRANPSYLQAQSNLAAALSDLGRIDEAHVAYRKLIEIAPSDPASYRRLAEMLVEAQRESEAIPYLEEVVQLQPEEADAHFNLATIRHRLGEYARALDGYDAAIRLKPDFIEATFNRAGVLGDLGRDAEAIDAYGRLIDQHPEHKDALLNRGVLLQRHGRSTEALDSLDRAVAIEPNFVEAHYNRGVALEDLDRDDEALAAYERAIDLKPDHVIGQWNKALLLLASGDFERGWALYESRWQQEPFLSAKRNFEKPQLGPDDEIARKTIVLHAEQGLGDTLQFSRYALSLAERGATVVMEVQPELQSAFGPIATQVTVCATGAYTGHLDFHSPLLSMPHVCRTRLDSVPAPVPYVAPPPEVRQRWKLREGASERMRVGIVFSGSATHKRDTQRSIPLQRLMPLFDLPVEWHCLQKEIRTVDRPSLAGLFQLNLWCDELATFADTAALIEHMDLVISVDTSVAHLAGAMGKPTWLLLASNPDFRWMRDRTDTPWYPSMKLYRQSHQHDWNEPLAAIKADLLDEIRQFRQGSVQ